MYIYPGEKWARYIYINKTTFFDYDPYTYFDRININRVVAFGDAVFDCVYTIGVKRELASLTTRLTRCEERSKMLIMWREYEFIK